MSIKVWSILGTKRRAILSHFKDSFCGYSIVMEAITEKEEKRIDKSPVYYDSLRHELKNGIIIEGKDIYAYGQIDFTKEEDINLIKRLNFTYEGGNNWVETSFNYDDGTITSIDGISKGSVTYDPVLWAKYNHVRIGKPERIIIYKIKNVLL